MKSLGTRYMDPLFIFKINKINTQRPTSILHTFCIFSKLHIRTNIQDERNKLPPRYTFSAFAGLLQFRDKPKQQLPTFASDAINQVMDDFFLHGTSLVGRIKEIGDLQVNDRAVITLL